MTAHDIPAPTPNDKPFKIGDRLTVYEAAMVYAGRHPWPQFFCLKDSSAEDRIEILKLGLSRRASPRTERAQRVQQAHARRRWDIYCDIVKRIEQGKIQPVQTVFDLQGQIDFIRTVIQTSDLAILATERKERPRYLRHLQDDQQPIKPSQSVRSEEHALPQARRRGRRPWKLEIVKEAIRADIQKGQLTPADLRNMLEKNMEGKYDASRDTCRKARKAVLSENVDRQIATNDK